MMNRWARAGLRWVSLCILLLIPAPVKTEEPRQHAVSSIALDRAVHCWKLLGHIEQAWQHAILWQQTSSELPDPYGELAVLAIHKGKPVEALSYWKKFESLGPDVALTDHLLEELAWGTLQSAAREGSLQQRMIALQGQAFTRDVRALPALQKALGDPSPEIRAYAAEAVPLCCDLATAQKLEDAYRKEKVLRVRAALLGAMGRCGAPSSHPLLLDAMHDADAELQVAAIGASMQQLGYLDSSCVALCLAHPRAPLRALGCRLAAAHLSHSVAWHQLIRMCRDPHKSVRDSAWSSMLLLPLQEPASAELLAALSQGLKDPAKEVVVAAATVGARVGMEQAFAVLAEQLDHQDRTVRLRSITLLATGGPSQQQRLEEIALTASDPLMRLNAQLALLPITEDRQRCARQMVTTLEQCEERLMPSSSGAHLSILPSQVPHVPGIANYPEAVDLLTRLRVWHAASCGGAPLPQELLVRWLEETRWGLSAVSAQMLLQEGDQAAVDVVRGLLQHPKEQIRLQAALLLASVGRDPGALPVLQELLPSLCREERLQVLLTAGALGARELQNELVEALADGSLMTRILAASSLLQMLYH